MFLYCTKNFTNIINVHTKTVATSTRLPIISQSATIATKNAQTPVYVGFFVIFSTIDAGIKHTQPLTGTRAKDAPIAAAMPVPLGVFQGDGMTCPDIRENKHKLATQIGLPNVKTTIGMIIPLPMSIIKTNMPYNGPTSLNTLVAPGLPVRSRFPKG